MSYHKRLWGSVLDGVRDIYGRGIYASVTDGRKVETIEAKGIEILK